MSQRIYNEDGICLELIESTSDFWALYDELLEDKSLFINNRDILLIAFKEARLWGLRVEETDSMYERGARVDSIFCKNSFYLLPCLCITSTLNNQEEIIIIWTHTRARRKGFAKKMIDCLSKKSPTGKVTPCNIMEESIPFWKACGLL
jgi:hypothetical protein